MLILQNVLAALAALLFAAGLAFACARLLRREGPFSPHSIDRAAALRAGAVFFALGCAAAALFALRGFLLLDADSLEQAFAANFETSGIDARHYVHLAEYGYGAGEEFPEQYLMIVFFPLFPWLIRLVHALTGLGWYTCAILLQPPLLGGAAALLHALAQAAADRSAARRTLLVLAVLPGSFFLCAPLSDGLFLLLSSAALLALLLDRPALFFAAGLAAALTRSLGGLLAGTAGVLVLQLLFSRRPRRAALWLAAALGPCLGTAAYLGLNHAVYGSFFQFSLYQKDHWNQQLGFFADTVRYHLSYLVGWWDSNRPFALWVSLTAIVFIFAQLALVLSARRRLPLPFLFYALAYIAVADGATWLLSAPRYNLGLPPIALAAALLPLPRRLRAVLWGLCLAFSLGYLGQFLAGGPIY